MLTSFMMYTVPAYHIISVSCRAKAHSENQFSLESYLQECEHFFTSFVHWQKGASTVAIVESLSAGDCAWLHLVENLVGAFGVCFVAWQFLRCLTCSHCSRRTLSPHNPIEMIANGASECTIWGFDLLIKALWVIEMTTAFTHLHYRNWLEMAELIWIQTVNLVVSHIFQAIIQLTVANRANFILHFAHVSVVNRNLLLFRESFSL